MPPDDPDDGGFFERRQVNVELIAYQIGELKGMLRELVERVDTRLDKFDDRQRAVERSLAEQEARIETLEAQARSLVTRDEPTVIDAPKIILAVLGLLGTALAIIAAGGIPHP